MTSLLKKTNLVDQKFNNKYSHLKVFGEIGVMR